MVDGFVRLMATDDAFTGPINLGNPQGMTIQALAELVLELTGSRSLIIKKPLPEDDPQQREPDIGLAASQLQWQPSTPLREGLQKTIAYFDALL
jgi:UDP-glucuronate decarboxylase